MAGAIVMVVILVIVLPVVILVSGAIGAGLLGGFLKSASDAENTDADGQPNEYLVLSESDPYES